MATTLIVVPLVAAVLCAIPLLSRVARAVAILASLAVSALAIAGLAGTWTVEQHGSWATALGASYSVATDGLSAIFLVLGGVLFAIGAAASTRVPHRRGYFALWCLLLAAVDGVFVARDLALFFVFWEAMLVPLGILMWQWGGADRRGATLRFLLYTMGGSALFLVALVSLAVARETLDMDALAARQLPAGAQLLPALLLLAAFAVKLPLFPFHAWLPRAYAAAPIPVALVLSGIVAKTAVYGIVRVCLELFPQGMATAAPVLVALAAVGTLYGALIATRQDDLRRLIAYSSLSHLNLIGLAVFAATATSLHGAILASVSHGLVVAALFLLAAMVARRTSSFALSRAGGLAASAPVLTAFATLAVVAAIGVPGTSGFAGEVVALAGTYERFPAAAIAATLVVIVAAVYGLGAIRRAFHGPPLVTGVDLAWSERLLLVPLLALIVAVGVAPRAITDRVPDESLPSVELVR
jgi:NADH-quinone oxidoreductase subunit M